MYLFLKWGDRCLGQSLWQLLETICQSDPYVIGMQSEKTDI